MKKHLKLVQGSDPRSSSGEAALHQSCNRATALLRLRFSRNRKTALKKLWLKERWLKKKPVQVPLGGPSGFVGDSKVLTDAKSISSVSTRWSLLDSSGLVLRNDRNNCWFHSTLYLLVSIPAFRSFCLSPPRDIGIFQSHLVEAISAICNSHNPATVAAFFPLVKDCDGVNHRYGQIAVPDFFQYLCSQSTLLSNLVTFTLTTRLQCSQCNWVRYPSSSEIALQLYFPFDRKLSTLEELVDFNSKAALGDDNIVMCSNCSLKTQHTYLRSCDPDIFFVELCRVTNTPQGLRKNSDPISFGTELKLPGFSRGYRIVASAHHKGTLRGGHWITRLCTQHGWMEADDLRRKHVRTVPPGKFDSSVVILVLVAIDKLS